MFYDFRFYTFSLSLLVLLTVSDAYQQVSSNTINPFTVETVGSHVSLLGEGPHWDDKRQVLYHVDITGGRVWKLDPVNRIQEMRQLNGLVSIVIPYENSDDLLVSLNNTVGKLNWERETFDVIAVVAPERNGKERFNDGKIDNKGRLWIGTILTCCGKPVKGGGSLYRLDGNHFTKMSTGYTVTNGMAWSHDNRKLYLNDSEERKTFVFDFDLESGTISNKKLLIDSANHPDFKPGWHQDGMTIDRQGMIWTALWGGGRVVQINPDTGRVENTILIPSPLSSSCFFGGRNYDQLFVTSATVELSPEELKENPLAGRTFKVTSFSSEFRAIGPGNRFKPTDDCQYCSRF